jgi:phage/plasmid-associated DNA primase
MRAAYYLTKKGGIVINESHFVQRICRENLVLFEYAENRFYRYNPETGAWEAVPPGVIKELVRTEWERYTRLFKEPALAFRNKAGLLHALVSGIESHAGRTRVFKRLEKTIHCATGMLKINAEGKRDLMPFSPTYYARNPIPIPWDPDAACRKFDALLAFALPAADVSLFWRWFGSVLLTGNAAQRILLMVGKAHTAKSTIAEVVELVSGLNNCAALRTKLLHERFEIGRLFGFSLLTARDVPGNFLEHAGAQALKALVGHDYTPGELKGSMVSVPVYGDFDCLITCNERLLVSLEGETDVEAWRHRLMVLEFINVIPKEERIANYAQILFAEEAPGILRRAVAGTAAHLDELKAGGNFIETDDQKNRVDHLLAESESVKYFVAERVCRVRGGPGLSTEELVAAYTDYCDERNWRPHGIKQAERDLPDIMMSTHGVHVGAHIVRNKKRVRGYPHVALSPDRAPKDDDQPDDQEDCSQGA